MPVEGLDEASLPVALHAGGRLVAVGRRAEDRIQPEKVFDAA